MSLNYFDLGYKNSWGCSRRCCETKWNFDWRRSSKSIDSELEITLKITF